jgi:two-component system, cell cycle response regulator DivK
MDLRTPSLGWYSRQGYFGKFVAAFVSLVVFVLVMNGIVETWFVYRKTIEVASQSQTEKAQATAQRIEQFLSEVERQISWATRASATTLEQRRSDYALLLQQVPTIDRLIYLDGAGKERRRLHLQCHHSGARQRTETTSLSKRILVVEDTEDNRRIFRDLLTHAGFELLEADDGQKGVAMAIEERPDLILMDIQLPILDGYEATRRIKANPSLRHIPIIAVTSYALSGDETKARAAGCDGYLAKPFSPRQILAMVREFLHL